MIETREREIDGHAYQVTMFPGLRAQKLAARIVKMFGRPLVELLSGAATDAGGSLLDVDVSAMGPAIGRLAENLDPDVYAQLLIDLFASTRRDNVEMNQKGFDMAYAGNAMEMFKAIGFIIEVNGFFPAAEPTSG